MPNYSKDFCVRWDGFDNEKTISLIKNTTKDYQQIYEEQNIKQQEAWLPSNIFKALAEVVKKEVQSQSITYSNKSVGHDQNSIHWEFSTCVYIG